MLLCPKIDLDLEEEAKVYRDAQETIAYLQDIMQNIESRVLDGEDIEGFEVKEGSKTRVITKEGLEYLERVLGEDKVYEIKKKPIGITKLEELVDDEEMASLIQKGVVAFKPGKPKVKFKGKE